MSYIKTNVNSEEELKHYGVLGMKWGVRRQEKKLAKAKSKLRKEKARRKKMKRIKAAVKYNNSPDFMKSGHVVKKRLGQAAKAYGFAFGAALMSAAITKRALNKGRMMTAVKSHTYGKTIVRSAKFLSAMYLGSALCVSAFGPYTQSRIAYDQKYRYQEDYARKKGWIK